MKIGRNDPCPCGSLKKYKKCCLLKEYEQERKEEQEWQEWFEEDLLIGRCNLERMELDKMGITDGYFIKYP